MGDMSYTKGPNPPSRVPWRDTLASISKLPLSDGIPARGIRREITERYGVRCSLSEEDGTTVTALYFPYYDQKGELCGYKKKDLTLMKGDRYYITTIGKCSPNNQLFGTHVFKEKKGGVKLFWVEGEEDVLATAQVLIDNTSKKYRHLLPHVVGLTNGTSHAVENYEHNEELIDSHRDIILAFDMDAATSSEQAKKIIKGQDAVALIAALNPNVLHCMYSEHDPCDMLKADKGDEFYWNLLKATEYEPQGFVTIDDVFEAATKMPEWGRPWPWPSLTKATYGRRGGEGYYIGAGVKIGKSEFVNQLVHHIIIEEDLPVAVFKLEEEPAMTARRIAGKLKHKQFHIPDGDFTQDDLIDGVNSLRGKLHMFDSYGATRWDALKVAIRQAVVRYGVKDIFIDPVTRLTAGMSASDTETELRRFADEISKLSKDLDFTYYCFCHLKAPTFGKPHERGGKVQSSQFRGSRAMMESTYYMIGIERDKDPELDEVERNTSKFVLLEDRMFGNTAEVSVFYNKDTGDYLEPSPIDDF